MKSAKKTFSILLVVILVFTVFPATTADAAPAKVKITWNANGGKIGSKATKTISYTKGKKIAKLQTVKRSGYTLKGWYTKKSGGKKVTKNTKAKKTTYYAQWTAKKYTLTFDVSGGVMNLKPKQLGAAKAYGTLPTPTRSGYDFQGWFTKPSGGAKVSNKTKMASKNVTVYAQWKRQQALSAKEKELLGKWGNGLSSVTDWHNYYTGSYEYTSARIDGIEFKTDGSFSCFSVLSGKSSGKTVIVVTEHKGDFRTGNKVMESGGSGLEGNVLHLTSVKVKQTCLVDYVTKQDESFEWRSIPDHNLACGIYLDYMDKDAIWFDPYQFDYLGWALNDYRVDLWGMKRIVN